MITRFSHIGIVVKNLDEALPLYTNVLALQVLPGSRIDFPELGFRSAIIPVGDLFIELMEGSNPNTELGSFIEKRGEGVYHLCFEVDDIDAEIESLTARGADVIEIPPSASVPAKRAFVRRRYMRGVLIELVSKSEHEAETYQQK
jgi:methylmalonyl-CoA epimerase